MRRVLGVVLAGGQSRRMGQDKAMLPWRDGQSLLHNAISILEACCDQVWVSGRPFPPYNSILDIHPGQGPLGALFSLSQALQHSDAQWDAIAVLPCDMPLVAGEYYAEMVAYLESHARDSAVLLAHGEKIFPLTALYRFAGLHAMARSFELGNRRVTTALQELPHGTILKPEHSLQNVNHPADYQQLLKTIS